MRDGEVMMTSRTHKEHNAKQQPRIGMRAAAWCVGLSLSPTNTFGGELGQETSIDSRYIRH